MNRFHKAWLALTGRLEPEVRHLPNPEAWSKVYAVRWDEYKFARYGVRTVPRVEYFHSCAQALEAHPSRTVAAQTTAHINGRFFVVGAITEIEVQPKPKRPKGVRRG